MKNESKTEIKKPKPHSEAFFGEVRDYWWNRDFLELMGKRLKLAEVKTALDVGSGIGHWGQLLLPLFAEGAMLTGVDREPQWIIKAEERANKAGLSKQCTYQLGDANALPFPDASFDLVTCQTVLIHLKDPRHAIREMIRVLKPGGLLLAAEPNNLANQMIGGTIEHSVDEVMERVRFHLMCERGKEALGLGNISLGDLVPGYFAELGLERIDVYLNDKSNPLYAPYADREQQSMIQQTEEFANQDSIGWDREETQSYFLAGGGTLEEFPHHWNRALKDMRDFLAATRAGTYHSAGGGVSYLVSGRKQA